MPQRCIVAWVWQRTPGLPFHIHTYTHSFPSAELGYKTNKQKNKIKTRAQGKVSKSSCSLDFAGEVGRFLEAGC